MRGAVLPAALLCAALGLMLAFAPRRFMMPALAALLLSALIASIVPDRGGGIELLFAGCWVSLILIALALHLPRGVPGWLAIVAACDAGLWSGLLIGAHGDGIDLVRALPLALTGLPGLWMVRRGWGIALKVASSWLIAIAVLAALLPATPMPGYAPDHMD